MSIGGKASISHRRRWAVFSFKGGFVAAKFNSRLWLAVGVFVSGLAALVVFRSIATAAAVALLASLSASAVAAVVGGAASGKAGAVASVHAPAFVGSLMGALLLQLQLGGRTLPARIIITLVSLVAAYFGGVAAWEAWPEMGAGSVGVAGTACAYLVVPVLDALRALLGDIRWLKRLISFRLGAGDATPQLSSTETGDNSVNEAATRQ